MTRCRLGQRVHLLTDVPGIERHFILCRDNSSRIRNDTATSNSSRTIASPTSFFVAQGSFIAHWLALN